MWLGSCFVSSGEGYVLLCDSNDIDGDRFGEGVVVGDVLTITTNPMLDGWYHSI